MRPEVMWSIRYFVLVIVRIVNQNNYIQSLSTHHYPDGRVGEVFESTKQFGSLRGKQCCNQIQYNWGQLLHGLSHWPIGRQQQNWDVIWSPNGRARAGLICIPERSVNMVKSVPTTRRTADVLIVSQQENKRSLRPRGLCSVDRPGPDLCRHVAEYTQLL